MPIIRDDEELTTSQAVFRNRAARWRAGRFVPVVGASLTYDLVLAAGEADLATAWAEDLGATGQEMQSVARVAEYAYFRRDDDFRVNLDYLHFLKRALLGRARDDPGLPRDLLEELIAEMDRLTFTEMAAALDYSMRGGIENPLLLLADLPVKVYITTSVHGLLQDALVRAGKQPRTAICNWNKAGELLRPEDRLGDDYTPTVATPLVFHLYGHEEYPESIVLSDDQCLQWLASVESGRGSYNTDPFPALVRGAAFDDVGLVGFRPESLAFKVLWMGLLSESSQPDVRGAFQLDGPVDPGSGDQQQLEPYLAQYRQHLERELEFRRLDLFWGDAVEFLSSLREG